MIDERHEEDAALYSLGALSGDAATALEGELAGDSELRELVRELQETAAALALAAPMRMPPPELEQRIFSQISGERAAESPAVGSFQWVPWALAASLALVATIFGVQSARLRMEVAQMKNEAAEFAARDRLADMQIAALRSQVANAPTIAGAVAWDPQEQRGVLTLQKLPELTPAEDYQLWLIDPQYEQPVSAGIVQVGPDGTARIIFHADKPIASADAFAVSRESKGGASAPQGPIILMGN